MAFLDIFALIVLLVLVVAVIAIWVILSMLPGRIARAQNSLSNVHLYKYDMTHFGPLLPWHFIGNSEWCFSVK